ncbi:kinesin-like protein KIF9 [Ciona intestinalis]
MSSSNKKRVKVYVRFRPTSKFSHDNITFDKDGKVINIHARKNVSSEVVNNQLLNWSFRVDGILHNASQDQVYDTVASDMTLNTLEGFNSTLLAYGQTGAGKTFTITGATENYKHRGLIPRAIAQVFRSVEERSDHAVQIQISYFEIYNETMFDLLSTLPESETASTYDSKLTIVEGEDGSVCIKGLSMHQANNEGEALNYLFEGETNRAIASHALNKNSSRSHCIFTIHVKSKSRTESNAKYIHSKLNLVDLAGSERIGKTGSDGLIKREAMYINKSLTFLEQTVIALADKNREHIPFRQTKLTHALKDSIGGKCFTTMIANVYGESTQLEETVSTLRFALRMMRIPVQPAITEHYDPWLLVQEMEKEIMHLKQELEMNNTLANRSQISYDMLSESQIADINKQVRMYLQRKTTEIDVRNLRQMNMVFEQFRNVITEMEQDIKDRFKSKFVLLDKSDSEALIALQKAGIPLDEDGNYLGSTDALPVLTGRSGDTGTTQQAAAHGGGKQKHPTSPKRRSGKKSRAGGSPTQRAPISPSLPAPGDHGPKGIKSGAAHSQVVTAQTDGAESTKKDESSVSGELLVDDRSQSRPSTPPPRPVAFENFKKEQGCEIYRILNENKSHLQSKKQIVHNLAHAVNATKHMIDGTRMALERKQNERYEQGEFVNEEGETVIDEEEFQLITQLKNLKQTYRHDYEELRNVKSEIDYCQKLVKQCTQRLVLEFDNWYTESYMQKNGEANPLSWSVPKPGVQHPMRLQLANIPLSSEDEQDKFQRLQETMLGDQEEIAFQNARMRVHRRKVNEQAMNQAQPARRLAGGFIETNVRNKPPNQMSYVM